ncbi:hypothetical protein ACFQ9X_19820 [Catenulispora yoronensis]
MDELSDAADEAMLRRPETPEAADAARRAVEAAERLLDHDGGLPNQRRLARALWRRVSTYALPGERGALEHAALRCWSLCVGMLDTARGDAVAFDDVVGDVGMWAGVLVPALGAVGRHAEAAQVYETSAVAAGKAMGARGRQARARLMLFPLAATADTMAQLFVDGSWNAGAEQALDDAITSCHGVLGVLRGYLSGGSFEVTEVARTLQVISRLQTVGVGCAMPRPRLMRQSPCRERWRRRAALYGDAARAEGRAGRSARIRPIHRAHVTARTGG